MNDEEFLEVVRLLADGRYLPTKAMTQRFIDKADSLVWLCKTRGATLDNIRKAIENPASIPPQAGPSEHGHGESTAAWDAFIESENPTDVELYGG